MSISYPKPLLGFAAFSGTGKTTLLLKLLPILKAKNFRVAVIKHAHHKFDVDIPGKDSYELRKAGATPMLISSSHRIAIMIEKEEEKEPDLQDLLSYINPDKVDLVLVEGFKQWPFPKIELHRPDTGKSLLFPDDDNIIAIAHDKTINEVAHIPVMDINNTEEIADFVIQFAQKHKT